MSADTPPPHVVHVREHLSRLAGGMDTVVDEKGTFLGEDDGTHFWEVVGLRLQGVPTLILAALRFRRHDHPGEPYARESLATYLASPPSPVPAGGGSAGHGEIPVRLPAWNETIPAFLSRMRTDGDTGTGSLSPRRIELAFDFRSGNPFALEAMRRAKGAMTPHVLRTGEGHVLYGLAHPESGNNGNFFALTHAKQFTPTGQVPLPPIMVRRDWLVAVQGLPDDPTRTAAARWAPFVSGMASPAHLLHL